MLRLIIFAPPPLIKEKKNNLSHHKLNKVKKLLFNCNFQNYNYILIFNYMILLIMNK